MTSPSPVEVLTQARALPSGMKLKVWWIPQLPMKSFDVEVASVEEGRKLCRVLGDYDLFQYENRIKPDYCNAGGIVFSHPDFEGGDWIDVPDDDDEWQDILGDLARQKEAGGDV